MSIGDSYESSQNTVGNELPIPNDLLLIQKRPPLPLSHKPVVRYTREASPRKFHAFGYVLSKL